MKECCGNCKFNEYGGGEDFYCCNQESDAYGCETIYNESCDAFTAKEDDEEC